MKQKIHRKNNTFHVLDLAVTISAKCANLGKQVRHPFGDIVSQMERAAASVALNIAEGAGRTGKSRKLHYQIAYGSARETTTALEILVKTRCLTMDQVNETLNLLDQVRAILWVIINHH